MGKPAVSLRNKLIALTAAGLIACGFLPLASAFADDAQDDSVGATYVVAQNEGSAVGATPNSILASTLTSDGVSVISTDVMLDGDVFEPVIGSFTVDGLTFAVNTDGGVTLISVGAGFVPAQYEGSAEGATPNSVILSDDAERSGASAGGARVEGSLSIPQTITYAGTTYPVTAIGAYAFYLSGATQASLPASITSVDDRAFRSSDVAWVDVDADNPNIASFDGCLYDGQLLSLLLIPEGRAGAVLLPCETEVVEPSKFSHCSLVEAISVEEGGAAFASWDGLLYDATGTTLLRVPAGATEITIREGCTTIAVGAMEGCAKLERINAPASVTSISPNVFESVPTVSLPASVILSESDEVAGVEESSENEAEDEAEVAARRVVASSQGLEAPLALPDLGSTSASPSSNGQLAAMVALSSMDDAGFEVDASGVKVVLPADADVSGWEAAGFALLEDEGADGEAAIASLQEASAYNANPLPYAVAAQTRIASATTPDDGPVVNWITIQGPNSNVAKASGGGTTLSLINLASHCKPIGQDAYGVYYYNGETYFMMSNGSFQASKTSRTSYKCYYVAYYTTTSSNTPIDIASTFSSSATGRDYYLTEGQPRKVTWNANGGTLPSDKRWPVGTSYVGNGLSCAAPLPTRDGYHFVGWYTAAEGGSLVCGSRNDGGTVSSVTVNQTLYAHWTKAAYDISFDVNSEPGDEAYLGIDLDDRTMGDDDGQVEIADPKRPGYVFQGWVIPDAETGNKEALDQDLVYQGDDGKWYVDASKLPDYATGDKIELMARWTSIISVDVPRTVTFYADVVTQGNESREGLTSGAFGQVWVANQSSSDLYVVGLESSAVETTDTVLGADSVFRKATSAVPSTSTQKLLSIYPSEKAWTAEELQNPDAISEIKAANAVDFDLDDVLLEESFTAKDFTIPAHDTLNIGYRLNLTEAGQELDYEKLENLGDGQSVAIANVSYCFSGDPTPAAWSEPLWVKNVDSSFGRVGYYLFDDIKEAAEDLSAHSDDPMQSKYYTLYRGLIDAQATSSGDSSEAPYFKLLIDGVYWDLQLIGICQDTKSDGTGKAGLTFQLRDIFAQGGTIRIPGSGSYVSGMNTSNTNKGGWASSNQRKLLQGTFYSLVDPAVQNVIKGVTKYQQLPGGTTAAYLQKTTNEMIWLPSMYEVYGAAFETYNESEGLKSVSGYTPFQYMGYQQGGTDITNLTAIKSYITKGGRTPAFWWLRSAYRDYDTYFCGVFSYGTRGSFGASNGSGIAPAFCL